MKSSDKLLNYFVLQIQSNVGVKRASVVQLYAMTSKHIFDNVYKRTPYALFYYTECAYYIINYSRKTDLNIDLIGDGLNGLSEEFKLTAFASASAYFSPSASTSEFDWRGIGAHNDNGENSHNGELHDAAAFKMQI